MARCAVILALALVLTAMAAPPPVAAQEAGTGARPKPSKRTYGVLYDARIVPSERVARVKITITGAAGRVSRIIFRIDPDRHTRFEGNGRIETSADRVVWEPPEAGGELRYRFHIDHLRDERSYDARSTRTWVLFRGGDLVPPADVRAQRGAESVSRLRLRLPEGWRAATPYARLTGGDFRIDNPRRNFDRPTGWIVAGDLGIVREELGDMRVAIAAPASHGMRRQDILALLRWTSGALRGLFRALPERLLIVGAGDPMWRGGLSGPRSVFLHASRPLITGDGTSPLLHELLHSLLGVRAGPDTGWLVEGLAEHYSIELLRRSDTISPERHAQIIEGLRRRAASESAKGLRNTAWGVGFLVDLDARIRSETGGAKSLDDVARALEAERPQLTREIFVRATLESTGIEIDDAWPG